jgi:hypothetical protein
MRTLSRPTGPNELFTILAMAWQAMTALTPNNIDIKILTISTACKKDERGLHTAHAESEYCLRDGLSRNELKLTPCDHRNATKQEKKMTKPLSF